MCARHARALHIRISASIHYSVARVLSRVVDDYSKVMRSGWRSAIERASPVNLLDLRRVVSCNRSFRRGKTDAFTCLLSK